MDAEMKMSRATKSVANEIMQVYRGVTDSGIYNDTRECMFGQ